MKIAIFGLGYVGLTSAGCLLKEGHSVVGVDINAEKTNALLSGKCPIFEPGLEELIQLGIKHGRLTAGPVVDRLLDDCDMALVCVGTPSAADGSHNMTYLINATRDIAAAVSPERKSALTVVYRSTVRPGTMDEIIRPTMELALGEGHPGVELVYNPEFLRESSAISDYFSPPKIVIGTSDSRPNSNVDALYSNINSPRFITGFRESEITKFVDNSFHALKVAFANELGRICVKNGISAKTMYEIFISDTKLNISAYYLRPGSAFGGSCLPKDVRALTHLSSELGADTPIMESLIKSNEAHKTFIFRNLIENLNAGASVLINGIAFKANSDDLRESPNLDLALSFLNEGYDLEIYDPCVKAEHLMGQNLGYSLSHLPALASLLVSEETLQNRTYDLIVDSRGNASTLPARSHSIVDISTLP